MLWNFSRRDHPVSIQQAAFWTWSVRGMSGVLDLMARQIAEGGFPPEDQTKELRRVHTLLGALLQDIARGDGK